MIAEDQTNNRAWNVPQSALNTLLITSSYLYFIFSLLNQQLCRKCTLIPVCLHVSALHTNWLTLGQPDLFNLTETACLSVLDTMWHSLSCSSWGNQFVVKSSACLDCNRVLAWHFLSFACKVNVIAQDFNRSSQIVTVSAYSLIHMDPLGPLVHKLTAEILIQDWSAISFWSAEVLLGSFSVTYEHRHSLRV